MHTFVKSTNVYFQCISGQLWWRLFRRTVRCRATVIPSRSSPEFRLCFTSTCRIWKHVTSSMVVSFFRVGSGKREKKSPLEWSFVLMCADKAGSPFLGLKIDVSALWAVTRVNCRCHILVDLAVIGLALRAHSVLSGMMCDRTTQSPNGDALVANTNGSFGL
jgi:hypothetical protein